MQNPRPSNILIRAFVLIFSSLAIFVLGSIFFNMSRQNRETPEGVEELEQGLWQPNQKTFV